MAPNVHFKHTRDIMAIVVRHEDKGNEQFVLLGTGFGMFKVMRRFTFGDLFSTLYPNRV